jgi:hypothetical protein
MDRGASQEQIPYFDCNCYRVMSEILIVEVKTKRQIRDFLRRKFLSQVKFSLSKDDISLKSYSAPPRHYRPQHYNTLQF